jgi:transcriptional regulator with XRE-family HTH domain
MNLLEVWGAPENRGQGVETMTKLTAQDQLRRRREQLGLSRQQVADMTGLPVSRIWASEQTKVDVTPEDRQKITSVYNRRVEEIGNLHPIS